MPSVIHLCKQLTQPPVVAELAGIGVRSPRFPRDTEAWLTLRDRTMAGETPAARRWSPADLAADISSKPSWRPERMWLAKSNDLPRELVGSVTMLIRSGRSGSVPVVHWLLVHPNWRRRGIARLLMSHLERAAWDDGWREVHLETHTGWASAVAFYSSIGYAPLRDPAPR